MSTSIVPYSVWGAYESFLAHFSKAVEASNGRILPDFVPIQSCFVRMAERERVRFEIDLLLKGCPCSALPRKRALDIRVRALETIDRATWTLIRSTVYVNYFVRFKSKIRPIRLLHFDFEDGGKERHPFFHVQLMDSLISNDLRRFGLDVTVKPLSHANQEWIPSRIPTPDMTFASVLYCLAADHLNGSFTQFAKEVIPFQEKLPDLQFAVLRKSVDASKHFKSSHWFAHQGTKAG